MIEHLIRAIGSAAARVFSGRSTGPLERLFALKPAEELSEEEMAQLAPRIAQLHKYVNGLCIVSLIVGTILMLLLLFWVGTLLEPAGVDPIYDTRSRFKFIAFPFSGFLSATVIMCIATRLFVAWWMQGDLALHDRYKATRGGTHPGREARLLMVVGTCAAVFMAVVGLCGGVRIDQRGLTWTKGILATQHKGYDEVTAVGLYEEVDAPIGRVSRANLRVAFRGDAVMEFDMGKGQRNMPRLTQIAQYVAEKSGVPITRGQVRPDVDD